MSTEQDHKLTENFTQFFWSEKPGEFIDRYNGTIIKGRFSGSRLEWNEQLIEIILHLAEEHVKNKKNEYIIVCNQKLYDIICLSALYNISKECIKLGKRKINVILDETIPKNKVWFVEPDCTTISGEIFVYLE